MKRSFDAWRARHERRPKGSRLPKLSDIVQFLNTDIWRLQAHKLPPRRSFWVTQLRIVLLAVRRFNMNKCELRASALTFYSLLSIVPVVALAFAVAKGFGVEKILGEQLMAKMQGQEEVAERIIGFAQSFLENTKGGAIAGVGIVLLFWTVIKVLGNVEKSFNDIGELKQPGRHGAQTRRLFVDHDDLSGVIDPRQQRHGLAHHSGFRTVGAAVLPGLSRRRDRNSYE